MKDAFKLYKSYLNGDALKAIKSYHNIDNIKKAVDFHHNDYVKRISQVKEGGAFAPSGDYAKRYIRGGLNGFMEASRKLNEANRDIKAVKKIQTATRLGTAGAGALALGGTAYAIHKSKKKKEEKEMNKSAFDTVNESFEKIAGLKDVLTGKNIKSAINDVKGGKAVINNFQKNLKHIEPSARQATQEAIGVMSKDLKRLKGRVAKEGAKTVGAYAAPLAAGAYGVSRLKNKKKQEIEKKAMGV